jgi:ubiquinone/menaquinone biosynthesis C-methylase UbiE
MKQWLDIGPERAERYRKMYRWSDTAARLFAPADIQSGHKVADFGCGPGHAAVEFARKVGDKGHVHALDINAGFIADARANALAAGVADRVTAHLLKRETLPLDTASLDRIVTRNTLVYVRDPVAAFSEFRRVIGPGGLAHAVESDWWLTAVEPLGGEWTAMVEAASAVWRTPDMGRKLYGAARSAGFSNIALKVLTSPDREGRLLGMIETVAGYARDSGRMDPARPVSALDIVRSAIEQGTYLAVAPQFLATAEA